METFWEHRKAEAIKTQLRRAINLARTNPDYQMKHPNECRDNPSHKILTQCHPEAKKRIIQEMTKKHHNAEMPTVERPKRLNR